MTNYHIERLSVDHAWDILSWRYPAPYDFYNPPASEPEYVAALLNPVLQFHAVLDEKEQMVGFCSYGVDGQIPGGDYTKAALDIGLGMRPGLTGQGKGEAFLASILGYARGSFDANSIRLTVGDFNLRARSLYKKFGFREQSRFSDPRNQVDYTVMTVDLDSQCPVPLSF